MYVLRVLGVLLIITVGFSFLVYAFTGERRYLDFAFRLLKYSLFSALLLFALLFLERALLIPL